MVGCAWVWRTRVKAVRFASPPAMISLFVLLVFCGMSARYGKIGDLQKLQNTPKTRRP